MQGFIDAYDLSAVPESWRERIETVLRQRIGAHDHPDAVAEALEVVPRSRPFDEISDLAEISAPTLVVASRDEADPGHPLRVGQRWAQAIPGARLLVEEEGPPTPSPIAWQGGRLSRALLELAEADSVITYTLYVIGVTGGSHGGARVGWPDLRPDLEHDGGDGPQVLSRLDLHGDETVLDAGCGSGRVTEALIERLPPGHVIAVDESASMISGGSRAPRIRCADLRVADLLQLELERPVDAILSTATFHWIADHELTVLPAALGARRPADG